MFVSGTKIFIRGLRAVVVWLKWGKIGFLKRVA